PGERRDAERPGQRSHGERGSEGRERGDGGGVGYFFLWTMILTSVASLPLWWTMTCSPLWTWLKLLFSITLSTGPPSKISTFSKVVAGVTLKVLSSTTSFLSYFVLKCQWCLTVMVGWPSFLPRWTLITLPW